MFTILYEINVIYTFYIIRYIRKLLSVPAHINFNYVKFYTFPIFFLMVTKFPLHIYYYYSCLSSYKRSSSFNDRIIYSAYSIQKWNIYYPTDKYILCKECRQYVNLAARCSLGRAVCVVMFIRYVQTIRANKTIYTHIECMPFN